MQYGRRMPILLSLMSYVLWALALPFFMLHPKMRGFTAQRLGRVPALPTASASRPRYWLHGASAGDVLALVPTARALRAYGGPCDIVLSTMTSSGMAMAQGHKDLFDETFAAPLDVPWVTRRAVARLKPSLLVLEYTELWPQLLRAACRAQVPIALHNGRFGARSARRYRWLFALTGNLLSHLNLLLMRDDDEAARAIALGADAKRVLVTGNTKFDNLAIRPDTTCMASIAQQTGWGDAHTVLVFGSTHDGEEEALLGVYVALKKAHPALRLIVAPRYAERAERVRHLCHRRGLATMMRHQEGPKPQEPADVLVLNTVGELTACYTLAKLVFVGGSFVPRGGQNILEPAAAGRPVLFGPYMHNFTDAVGVLVGRGGIQVASPAQLQRVMSDLLQHPRTCTALGEVARHQVQAVSGAASRNAALLAELAAKRLGHASMWD